MRLAARGYLILCVVVAFVTYLSFHTLHKLDHDESALRTTAVHTRAIQKAGEPVAVCLLDALKAVSPLLLKVPTVEKPLEAYIRLQSQRYPGVSCPEGHPSH
jgi:hypothetical protein